MRYLKVYAPVELEFIKNSRCCNLRAKLSTRASLREYIYCVLLFQTSFFVLFMLIFIRGCGLFGSALSFGGAL